MKRIQSQKKRTKYIYTSLVLLMFGLSFLAYPLVESKVIGHLSQGDFEIMHLEQLEHLEADVTFNFSDVDSVSARSVISAVVNSRNLPVIGRIMVPSVNIDLAIIEGVSNAAMSTGAGTLKPNQVMGEGNFALASHHMRNPNLLFTPLDRVELGETIYLTNGDEKFEYIIIEKEVIEATRVEVIEDQEDQTLVTLITCTDDEERRLMVVGKLVEA